MKSVTIGEQTWALENLSSDTFNNGDKIKIVKSLDEWREAYLDKVPACCYYEFKKGQSKGDGLLYNWYAITDSRGLAPEGWSIPSDKDWSALIELCGKKKTAGESLKANNGWGDEENNGKDTFGFSVLPSGYINNRFGSSLEFMNSEYNTIYWTSTLKKGTTNEALYWLIGLGKFVERDTANIETDFMGLSVRCIKKTSETPAKKTTKIKASKDAQNAKKETTVKKSKESQGNTGGLCAIDFYCQTEAGLKKEMKESGVDNIDPWEDMEEDAHIIKEHLFPKISLTPLEYVPFNANSKYILRFVCTCETDFNQYLKNNSDKISSLVQKGWAPFSLGGKSLDIAELISKDVVKNIISNLLPLKEQTDIIGKIQSFKK